MILKSFIITILDLIKENAKDHTGHTIITH